MILGSTWILPTSKQAKIQSKKRKVFICSTPHWIDVDKHFHSFHQLMGMADGKLKTDHTRILAPEVEVHYRLESVSSARFNVSFKPWQKRYHNIHPVSPAFPAKIRGRQIQQQQKDTYSNSLKCQPSLSHGFRDWADGFVQCILSHLRASGLLLDWRPEAIFQANSS